MAYSIRIMAGVLGAALTFCLPACVGAQETSASGGEISETLRTVAYPHLLYPHGLVPEWDRGFFLHHDIERHFAAETPNVTEWDASGQHVRDGRIWPPGAASVRIRRAAATRDGAILAAGWAILQDGSVTNFIAKTDLSGNTVQVIRTDYFETEELCEAGDGSVWTLGQEIKDGEAREESDVLRQYCFEGGLLHSYLPRRSVEAVVRSNRPWFTASGSFLRCGKDRVSGYLNFTDEYLEVNALSSQLKRWKLDVSVVDGGKASGLGITGDGTVYASFSKHGVSGPSGLTGLYEVRADATSQVARLLPVKGTVSILGSHDPDNRESGTFYRLWGADRNELAVRRAGEQDVSWVTVSRHGGMN